MKGLAEGEGATLFMVLLGAYQALLSRYSGQADLAVGAPVANRTRPELEGLIGFFANTLVLRADLSGAPTVRGAPGAGAGGLPGGLRPPGRALRAPGGGVAGPSARPGATPWSQAVFTLDGSSHQPLRFGQVQATLLDVHGATAKFDLLLECSERADGLHATIEYSTDLFQRETAQRLLGHLRTLLEGMAADPDARLDDLPLLPAAERAQLLTEWGANAVPYPAQDTVHGLFAAQAGRTPDAVALSGDGDALTYGELEARANRLAHHLSALGVGPETRVGLCLDRSAGAVVAILAVLKAGGAYVPLDPAYPPARLAWMLEDAGVEVLLTESRLAGRLPADLWPDAAPGRPGPAAAVAARPASDPSSDAGPDHLAYVMYTSGSTGRPKGVAVTHRGVVRLVKGPTTPAWGRRRSSSSSPPSPSTPLPWSCGGPCSTAGAWRSSRPGDALAGRPGAGHPRPRSDHPLAHRGALPPDGGEPAGGLRACASCWPAATCSPCPTSGASWRGSPSAA